MISLLTGTIYEKCPPFLVLLVNQVGYEIHAPMTTFYKLPEIGDSVTLHIHLCIREDAHLLFGFLTKRDRELFRALIKINGVGPKLALSILSGIEPEQFLQAITQQDTSTLTKIPGIGKKTAERLIIECKDSLQKLSSIHAAQKEGKLSLAYDDALEALQTLGFKSGEAKKAVDKIYQAGLKAEELIRQALSQMVK